MNVINELSSTLGLLYSPAMYIGAIGMFAAPILAFLSLKGRIIRVKEEVHTLSQFFLAIGSIASVGAGLLWIGALFSIFPGVLFCSVYCLIGLALPILGVGTACATVFLTAGFLLKRSTSELAK